MKQKTDLNLKFVTILRSHARLPLIILLQNLETNYTMRQEPENIFYAVAVIFVITVIILRVVIVALDFFI